MSLARAWMRQLSGASGAAMLVPVAVFGSMVLLALAGGFGSLGGLGQALGGPSIPSGTRSAGAAGPARADRAPAPAPALLTAAGAPALLASSSQPASSARGGTDSRRGRRPGGSNGGGTKPANPAVPAPPGSPAAPGPAPPPTPGPAPPPAPAPSGPPAGGAPPPRPTLIDGVVSVATSITSRIPGPIGQLATQTLQSVGQTVDKILPGNARSAVASAGGAVSSTVSQLQSGVSRLGSGVSGLLHGT